jgi:hypothetical protein
MIQPGKPFYRRVVQACLFVACAAAGVWQIIMPDFVRSGPCKTNQIINNLRQLDGVCAIVVAGIMLGKRHPGTFDTRLRPLGALAVAR